jgi:hypothetical protein
MITGKLTWKDRLIIIGLLVAIAAAISTLPGCTTGKGGCYATKGMSGYGH